MHGGGQVTDTAAAARSILTCDICGTLHETTEGLHAHLAQDHRLASTGFNPARDCLDGQSACNHCGAVFEHLESLRSHINQGRCGQFAPDLPTEVLTVQPAWELATSAGKLVDTLRDSHTRLQLTLQCQNCSCRYSRPADLSGHLVAAHSQLWSASQGLTHILVSLLYNQVGCTCNPSTSQHRANHVCNPLRQLAMQHMRLRDVIFFPHDPTEAELAQMFSAKLDRDSRFRLERLLTTRLLHELWLDDHILAITRSTCLLCAEVFHVAELPLHMYEAHHCGIPLVKFLVQQLLPKFLNHCDNDVQCYACHQVINLRREDTHDPTMLTDAQRSALVQAHFKAQCPCLIQAAVLLSRAANGRHDHARSGRRHEPSLASVPGDGAHVGSDTPIVPECSSQAPKKRRLQPRRAPKARSIRQNPTGTGGDAHGQIGSPNGQGAAGDEERGHLHSLFRQQRERRLLETAATSHGEMGTTTPGEPAGTPEGEDHAAEAAPGSGPFQYSSQSDSTTGISASGLRSLGGCPAQSSAATGPHVPISGMGPWAQGIGAQQSTATHPDPSATDLHRHAGGPDGDANGSEVSRTTSRAEAGRITMEIAGEYEDGQPVAIADGAEPLSHLDAHGDITSTPQPPTKPIGSEPAEDLAASVAHQGQGQRQEEGSSGPQNRMNPTERYQCLTPELLLQRLAHMSMENPGNICFSNATTSALLWTTLSTMTWSLKAWGKQCQMLHDFICTNPATCINLCDEVWFQQILHCWGLIDPAVSPQRIAQQDSAEFVAAWLEQMGSDAFDMRWEKRISENDSIRICDQGCKSTPICLKFTPFLADTSCSDLTQLFAVWQCARHFARHPPVSASMLTAAHRTASNGFTKVNACFKQTRYALYLSSQTVL